MGLAVCSSMTRAKHSANVRAFAQLGSPAECLINQILPPLKPPVPVWSDLLIGLEMKAAGTMNVFPLASFEGSVTMEMNMEPGFDAAIFTGNIFGASPRRECCLNVHPPSFVQDTVIYIYIYACISECILRHRRSGFFST
jgi:hypothetical protein